MPFSMYSVTVVWNLIRGRGVSNQYGYSVCFVEFSKVRKRGSNQYG